MARFNVFYMIHKGLRAMMYDASLSLQHTDWTSSHHHHHSLERLEHVLEVLDAHAGHEDGHVFTMLQACNPKLQTEMEKEHVTDIALSNELRSLSTAYKATTNTVEQGALGYKICCTFNEYV